MQAGFLTVATQLAMLLAALPSSLLLPPSLPLQLAVTLPLLVGLILIGVPQVADRLFGHQGDGPLVHSWFGVTVLVAMTFVGLGFGAGVYNGILTVTEAQILALLVLFFLNLSIARTWLGPDRE